MLKRMFKHLAVVALSVFALLCVVLSTTCFEAFGNEPGGNEPGGNEPGNTGGEPGGGTDPNPVLDTGLLNPSFEQGTDAPDNWTTYTGEVAGEYAWDAAVFSAGAKSVSTHGTRWRYGRWSSGWLAVEADNFQWYTLSGKVKTTANNGEVYLSIAWFDKDGAMITTSDSAMMSEGDNGWSTLTVSALPPSGALTLSAWCISNHNDGQTWFDDLALTRTAFPTTSSVSYGQFLIEYSTHPLAVEANMMQVQELMTEAKWTMEDDFYNTDGQLSASRLYGQAAGIQRKDTVYANVFTALYSDAAERARALAAAKARFDGLIDNALWEAVQTSEAGGDTVKAQEYLSILEGRGTDVGPVGTTD